MSMHWRVRGYPSESLLRAYRMVPREGSVLDVGCWGFQQMKIANHLGLTGLKHFGVDCGKPEGVPAGMVYKQADLDKEPIPFPDDSFDFVIASHVIEHLGDQIAFFGECVRVCKPGGCCTLKRRRRDRSGCRGIPSTMMTFTQSPFGTTRPIPAYRA